MTAQDYVALGLALVAAVYVVAKLAGFPRTRRPREGPDVPVDQLLKKK